MKSVLRSPVPAAGPSSVAPSLCAVPGSDSGRGDAGGFPPELLIRAQRGERDALEEFVRFHQRPVFAFLSRCLGRDPRVEDLAQEVFLRALGALPRYEQRGVRLLAWLFKIALRLVQDETRRREEQCLEYPDRVPWMGSGPEQRAQAQEELSSVERLSEQLPAPQRTALVLRHFHHLSHEEIAAITGVSTETVKTRIHRARHFLRRGLAGPSLRADDAPGKGVEK